MTTLILFTIGLVTLSMIMSLFETSLLSCSTTKLAALSEAKPHLKKLKTDNSAFTSTFIITSNIVDVVGAALSGSMASNLFGGSNTQFIYVMILTLSLLYIATLYPKQFATHHADSVLKRFGRIIILMNFILKPIVSIILIPISPFLPKGSRDTMTHAELRSLINMARSKSLINERQTALIDNILNITSLKTHQAMTPVKDLECVDGEQLVSELESMVKDGRHKRYVVIKKFRDKIYPIGILQHRKLVKSFMSDNNGRTVLSIMHPLTTMRDDEDLLDVFNQLDENPDHITVVINKQGELMGIIQADDIIHTLSVKPTLDVMPKEDTQTKRIPDSNSAYLASEIK